MSAEHIVKRDEVQGNILCGYGNDFPHALYLFIRFGNDQGATRKWLRELIPRVTTAEPWRPLSNKPNETLNIAFTHRGLKRLGVPKAVRDTFPEEFRKGMDRRAEGLGDTGESAPTKWDDGLVKPHAVLIVMCQTDVRDPRQVEHTARIEEVGGLVTHAQRADLILVGDRYSREHFGFADGFSQPAIRGNAGPDSRNGMGTPTAQGWDDVAPGEFVLGYPGEDGRPPYSPAEPLGYAGSYMVLRKLQQDVGAFRSYLRKTAKSQLGFLGEEPPGRDDPERPQKLRAREEVIAAKMVGRRRDGRSLVTDGPPTVPPGDPALDPDQINRFRYWERPSQPDDDEYLAEPIDPFGVRCPVGSHVRRANPRDGLGWDGLLVKRHRIIRRGMPYGEPVPAGEFDVDESDRGLIFVCYQADIARQFELIQRRWLNDGDAFWLGDDTDCLTMSGGMRVQGEREPTYLPAPPKPFITTRGGGYFFAPGLPALRALGAGFWR